MKPGAVAKGRGLGEETSAGQRLARGLLCWVLAVSPVAASFQAGNVDSGFELASKFYEQGRYPEAAAAYERLQQTRPDSEALLFNLGNAWFKAGQTGRAIGAWRRAERLAPRDPSIRFNLQFARKKVAGSDPVAGPAWRRGLAALTLNEWSVLASVMLWTWFCLLALREVRPSLRQGLAGYIATAGLAAVLLAACVAAAARLQLRTLSAVVIVPEAIARSGPLDEAKVLHHFRDGTELTVVDHKELPGADQPQSWLQVRDAAQRMGWLKGDQVALLTDGAPRSATSNP